MSSRACCAGGWRAASSWCAPGRGPRTRSTRCCCAAWPGKPPFADLLGKSGRRWLRQLELPVEECETVQACMRHIEFLDTEIADVERVIARYALGCSDARRPMSVPGVNVICAATFRPPSATSGGFAPPASWSATSAWTLRSASPAARRPRAAGSAKRGAGTVRWALVEAAASVIGQPGPMHAYYQRLRARRGHQIAVVAGARKLAVLFWCLLTRQQQYAHQQPSPTAKKLRLLEIRGGAPTLKGQRTGTFATREKMRAAERALALQAEASYVRMVRDWQAASPKKPGASVTPERA